MKLHSVKSLPALWQNTETRYGVAKSKLQVILQGAQQPLRDLKKHQRIGGLQIQIPLIAKTYGARQQITPDVLEGCVDLILDQFNDLGLQEIELAYRLWAAGKIEGLEMYGGEINATQLGRVLSSYKKYRNKVLNKYLDAAKAEQTALDEKKQHESRLTEYRNNFPAMIQQTRESGKIQSWQDVPAIWYDTANALGMIQFKHGEAVEIFKRATQLAKIEIAEEVRGLNSDLRSLIIARDTKKKDPKERAKVIARKITVFEKLINS
jgi:hypothetical protein